MKSKYINLRRGFTESSDIWSNASWLLHTVIMSGLHHRPHLMWDASALWRLQDPCLSRLKCVRKRWRTVSAFLGLHQYGMLLLQWKLSISADWKQSPELQCWSQILRPSEENPTMSPFFISAINKILVLAITQVRSVVVVRLLFCQIPQRACMSFFLRSEWPQVVWPLSVFLSLEGTSPHTGLVSITLFFIVLKLELWILFFPFWSRSRGAEEFPVISHVCKVMFWSLSAA